MLARLWGDHFFNPATKSWTVKPVSEDGTPLQRGFTHFVLDPISKLFDAVLGSDKIAVEHILQKLDITLGPDEDILEGMALLKAIMLKFLPATNTLLETVVLNLPSPLIAQRYRVENLYDGPMTDDAALGIKNCDKHGPLVVYISKLIPIVSPPAEIGRFYAFGRVFSGTVRCADKVRIQGPKYVPSSKEDLFVNRSVTNMILMHGADVEPLEDCPAGSLVGIRGIDRLLVRSGTLTDSETTLSIRTPPPFTVPVVQIALEIRNPAQLPQLVEGLKRLSKYHSHAQTWISEIGDHIIGGGDEHQVEASVQYLEEELGIGLKKSRPIVPYRERVTAESSLAAMSKSQNKKIRVYVKAMPLESDLAKGLEDADVGTRAFEMRSRRLADAYGWDLDEARKIWCFGPDNIGSNVLVDATKGVAYMNERKDGATAAFQWATKEGVCTEEPVRAVRFDIVDWMHHAGDAFRGNGQIIPTVRRVCYAAFLLASPAIQEPVYSVEIQCPESSLEGIRIHLEARRGTVRLEEPRLGTPIFILRAQLPLSEAFGLVADMRSYSATVHMVFDHWAPIAGCPLDKGSKAEEIVTAIRIRKGLRDQIPPLDRFLDKL
ncbi:hypothetical protein DFH07DRAFT_814068 [Mycena maculata]|uniref:Elongation factor EFG domain-containing protein n=1 Tax=Mycena maculata TaxID=230809 RepID=A0AAD7JD19_9AGAR|nr:hypothetical protein DFH07DRAFT_814068 [Mycena maculata]